MRRKKQEITSKEEIEAIIQEAKFCRLGLADGDQPYVVPLNFGYKDRAFYFHSAKEGKKIDLIRRSPKVCVELDVRTKVVPAEEACQWATEYLSVIGFGKAYLLQDFEEKREAFAILMGQYAEKEFHISEKDIHRTAIIKVEIDEMTGKGSD
ncbi:MAG: hypothetical protein MAG431_02454 [Chloroflexi bacterium]|nr:hypothetical protein [Chloroflexota bacterium]